VNEASRDDRDSLVSHDLRNPIRSSDGFEGDEGGGNAVQTSESWFGPIQTAGGADRLAKGLSRMYAAPSCVHARAPEGCARARGESSPGYGCGQVEPLVLLNLITSEVAEDRYFRVSFPGNRPRDSAAPAYFIRVRGPTPFYQPFPPSFSAFLLFSIRLLIISPSRPQMRIRFNAARGEQRATFRSFDSSVF